MRYGALLLLSLAFWQEDYKGAEEKLPKEVAPQPIAFSHKQHAAASLGCIDCHATARTADSATLPSTAKCMACHRTIKADSPLIAKLSSAHQAKEKIPWVRVYRVRDFVVFSHATHANAKLECDTCHGPVAERDVLAKEVGTNMMSCVACHRAKQAPLDCITCHQLGQ